MYEATFGEKVQKSMLDMDAVAAALVGRIGLGRDGVAEDETTDGGADEEGVSDAAQQEPGGDARGVEVTDDDSVEVDEDAFASSSKLKSLTQPRRSPRHMWTGAWVVPSAKLQYSIGGKRSYCTRKGRRCERTKATT
jgi:hypothetical protein